MKTRHYYKMILLSLFLAMGTTLFSCQSKEEKIQNVDKVEVVKDTTTEIVTIVGEAPIDLNDTMRSIPPPPKVDQIKLVKPKEDNSLKSEKTSNEKSNSAKVANKAVSTVEAPSQINAEFPGGIEQFHNFFMKEYKKPEGISYWKLNFNLAFAIEKNGTVSFLECSPALEEPLQKEIIRVLNLCPKWQPGELSGKKVRMQYSVPILLK